MADSRARFSAELARDLAVRAAKDVGLDGTVADLIRIGEHAMFRLPDRVVARVARGNAWNETAARELAIAAMLQDNDVPCCVPIDVEAPVMVDNHPVTFWHELDTSRRASFAEIGSVLQQLHKVEVPPYADVPLLRAFDRVGDRIASAEIDETDRARLYEVYHELQREWATITGTSQMRLIHGDPHSGNVAFAGRQPVLLDLETVCVGPAEWDLALPATYHATLGWLPESDYRCFVDAYGGLDVTTSPHFTVLRRIRELRMTSWFIQHAAESERTAAQARHRIACLVDGDLPRQWFRR